MARTRAFGKAAYIGDIPSYTENAERVFIGDGLRPDVQTTADRFTSRAIDNNYTAVYFPDVTISDPLTGRRLTVPASVAAMGAIAYSDTIAFPWYAPAGFSRGALSFVSNTQVRLNSADRDALYVSRINPIARMPDVGYVIFGQKTLQVTKSALDRLNVRRLLVEVKRIVENAALAIVFEQNTAATRNRFVDAVTPPLTIIQTQQGIESFSVVMDTRNNTEADVEANRLNGRIVITPTRTVEFIAIDFVVTNAGVIF
jgi:phage tail sheath protein FI